MFHVGFSQFFARSVNLRKDFGSVKKNAALLCGVLAIVVVVGALAVQPCFASGAAHPAPEDTDFPPDGKTRATQPLSAKIADPGCRGPVTYRGRRNAPKFFFDKGL